MRISDWSSDVCSSDLRRPELPGRVQQPERSLAQLHLAVPGTGRRAGDRHDQPERRVRRASAENRPGARPGREVGREACRGREWTCVELTAVCGYFKKKKQ